MDKMIMFMNLYWWVNINKATKSAHFACPTCPKYNPGKSPGQIKLPKGSLEVWQMDFMQLPLSNGCECVSVMVCMSSVD